MRPIAGVPLWTWATLLAAAVLLALALTLTTTSTPAVATVDGNQITLATYDGWLNAAAVSAHESDSAVPAFVPDAPSYSRCIAFERNAAAKTHSNTPTDATLKSDCANLRVTLAEDVMQFLLSGEWFLDQAAREHITVPASQVQRELHGSFPKTTGLTQFLNSSGLSRTDLKFEARAALVAQKLNAAHSGPTPTITSAQIASYYDANRSSIGNETLAQATPGIRETLIADAQAPTLDAWSSKVQRYYQPRTVCAKGYRIAYYCARGS